jgi:hypothetical protein
MWLGVDLNKLRGQGGKKCIVRYCFYIFHVILQTFFALLHVLYKVMFVILKAREVKTHFCIITCSLNSHILYLHCVSNGQKHLCTCLTIDILKDKEGRNTLANAKHRPYIACVIMQIYSTTLCISLWTNTGYFNFYMERIFGTHLQECQFEFFLI